MDDINANELQYNENISKNSQIEFLDCPDQTHAFYTVQAPSYQKGYLKVSF
jgi:hypothetical protein